MTDFDAAIARIEESRRSHAEWADHLDVCDHCKEHGPPPHIQNRDEHLQIVAQYDNVIACLREAAGARDDERKLIARQIEARIPTEHGEPLTHNLGALMTNTYRTGMLEAVRIINNKEHDNDN